MADPEQRDLDNLDVSAPYEPSHRLDPDALPVSHRPADASNKDDGYDEAQRAEIAEFEGGGPTDGVLMTDMDPDYGEDLDEDEIEDLPDGLDQVIDTDEL